MAKEIDLFLKEELTLKEKFYKYMDILISNRPETRFEALFFMIINYIQLLSLFYSEQVQVFNSKNNKSDLILATIEKVIRIKDLFKDNYRGFEIFEYCLFIIVIIEILHFLIMCLNITNNSIYSLNKKINNYFIKIFLFFAYNIILDISFSSFCLGISENNPNFNEDIKCSGNNRILIILLSLIFIVISFICHIFLQIYYNEAFILSNSPYAKMFSNYDIYMDLNCLFNSILFTQVKFLTKEFFLLYNLIVSISLVVYYIKKYIYYDKYINITAGIFHFIYAWTSIFSIIFAYINFNEKGIIYIISSLIVSSFYFNIKNRIDNEIFYNTPIIKFRNINYLLYYIKVLSEKIIRYDEKNENKAFISGILQVLLEERPNGRYEELLFADNEIYLPSENKWRDPKKRNIDDIVYLKFFITLLFNFIIYNDCNSPDIYFNLSMYYLKVMNNYCEAMYYCQKVTELKLDLSQKFTFMRLKLKISEALVERLKPADEQNILLENVNISMYYKYDDLSHNFIEEISNDIELSLEFWKIFKKSLKEPNFKISFNKVYKLTEKIQITKKNIEKMWNDLLKIYSGINEFFEFYNDYIDQINNDDLKKRDLDSIKKKAVNFNEHLNHNYYSVLFSNETGIMIVNGEKGCEGIIKQYNKKIELMFNYNNSELKEINISKLMPKLFDKNHSKYMERYFRVGYKKYMETRDFKTFGKDKNNSIIQIKLALKLLPILNYNVFFVGLIIKENINDIILIDENYNIQGMSSKLMKILNIDNIYLFQDNNIPFYIICKKFINFYNIFIRNKKKEKEKEHENEIVKKLTNNIDKEKRNELQKSEDKEMATKIEEAEREEDINENLEINENVELEFEIKLPQFLVNFAHKTNNKNEVILHKTLSMLSANNQDQIDEEESNNENDNDINNENDNDNDNENELLVSESSKRLKINDSTSNRLISTPNTPTPEGFTPTPTFNPNSFMKRKSLKAQLNNKFNKKSEEEKICFEKIEEYQYLFKEGKFEELEDLIDSCNKDSSISEYKFNFTFDKYKYGDDGLGYIVRCIDNRNQEGVSEEKSIELDSKAVKYKKEKANAIKPLFELLEEEREEILNLPEMFIKLSLEDPKFQELLESCKNEIINTSKTQGGPKKDEVLEDENSSQTSHSGFDNGLVKKNRIEEIRSNLFKNVSNFYALKYIKIIVSCISVFTIIFSIIFFIFLVNQNQSIYYVSLINLELFESTLWTTELISIFISLKTLYLKKVGKNNIEFLNFESEEIKTNDDYYYYMENLAIDLYNNSSYNYGQLEMRMPDYFSDSELYSMYWDNINVTFIKPDYIRNNRIVNKSFPTSIVQFLCNSINFLKKFNLTDNITFEYEKEEYFNYLTYLIIENAYDNILPNLFIKLDKIPDVLNKYNKGKNKVLYTILLIYIILMLFLCLFYFSMIHAINNSMTETFKKITKIKLEKIEETIKKIEMFSNDLKKFRDRDLINSDEENINDLKKDDFSYKKINTLNTFDNNNNSNNKKLDKKNIEETSSLVGSNGFNTDTKKNLPLTMVKEYLIHCFLFLLVLLGFLIPIYYFSISIIQNINQLLLIVNYIYGKLISTSVNIVEVKCFISECNTSTKLDYSKLKSTDTIQEVIKGLKYFENIEDYYNNKYLLNACEAAMDSNKEKERFELCKNDSIITSANNTDNLMKLIENIIDNIYKKEEMDEGTNKTLPNGTNVTYYKQLLFGDTNFQSIENIFYKYIFSVDRTFKNIINRNLYIYLKYKKRILVILIVFFALTMVGYNIGFLSFTSPKLVYLLNVSRCVLKIIPTSVIINTPELESWIESKY